jgi:hypothetical protein
MAIDRSSAHIPAEVAFSSLAAGNVFLFNDKICLIPAGLLNSGPNTVWNLDDLTTAVVQGSDLVIQYGLIQTLTDAH